MKYVKPLILVIFLVIALFVGKFTGISVYLDKAFMENFVVSMGFYGPFIFMLIYMVGTIFFVPGSPLTLLGGLLFGPVRGTIYTVIGASIGASLAFLFSRFLGKDFVDKILKNKFKKLEEYDEKLVNNGFLTTLFLRLVPLFPFNGLNFALGLTKMKFKDFALATLIGIIPGSFILASIGGAASAPGPMLYGFIGLFVLLGLVPLGYKRFIKK